MSIHFVLSLHLHPQKNNCVQTMKKKDIKILLVDDEQDILEIVGYNLSQEGYQIVTASNGKEAILKAKKELPEVMVAKALERDNIDTLL